MMCSKDEIIFFVDDGDYLCTTGMRGHNPETNCSESKMVYDAKVMLATSCRRCKQDNPKSYAVVLILCKVHKIKQHVNGNIYRYFRLFNRNYVHKIKFCR